MKRIFGEAYLKMPDSSLLQNFGNWERRDVKGAYRFFDSEGASHEALHKIHSKKVREMAVKSNQMVLFIQDGLEGF